MQKNILLGITSQCSYMFLTFEPLKLNRDYKL